MSEITKPILLDETGQEINETLASIQSALVKANHAFIDDDVTAKDRVWSSQKITEALTVEETSSGATISISPIAATPLKITSTHDGVATVTITHTNAAGKELTYTTVIPAAGTYNWVTGELELTEGVTAQLNSHAIMALNGTNTLSIDNGSMTVIYHTIGTGSGGSETSWDVIFGGNASEEV